MRGIGEREAAAAAGDEHVLDHRRGLASGGPG
jgi:hypothetical protein